MIVKNGLSLGARYWGQKAISAVYYGAKLVWEAIGSCFGTGAWLNAKGWSNTEGWRD